MPTAAPESVPAHTVHWKRAWRVINTHYPEIDLYSRVTQPKDRDAVRQIEALTNPRMRQKRREINLLRPHDHFPTGCHDDVIAPFVYRSNSRFSNENFGAFYCAQALETAAREKAFHYRRFLQDANLPALSVQMRVIRSDLRMKAVDLRGLKKSRKDLYDPDEYKRSQAWAFGVWSDGADGVVYDSVRDPGGQCAAVYRPACIRHTHKDRVLIFDYDGSDQITVSELQEFMRFGE